MQDTGKQPFIHERCLFCNKDSDDLDSSLLHMQTVHGLYIPDRKHLIVDLDVLVEYLHLVIFGYNECICCGTQRNTPQAVQQHMLGKSHCRFDISNKESEFADFYDSSAAASEADSSDDEDGNTVEAEGAREDAETGAQSNSTRPAGLQEAIQPDDTSLRLSSGKIISKGAPSRPHQRRQQEARSRRRSASPSLITEGADAASGEEGVDASSSSSSSTALIPSNAGGRHQGALTKSEKRAQAVTTQLARLSVNDQQSLAHLPASQQRSLLATQQKQAEKARRAERRYRSRVEGLGNKTLMGHYRAAGPERKNG